MPQHGKSRGLRVPNHLLIADLLRVARQLNVRSVTVHQYREHGRYRDGLVIRRFGKWTLALRKAGLGRAPGDWPGKIPTKELLADLRRVAAAQGSSYVGRQGYKQHGRYSFMVYYNRFGTWPVALARAGLEQRPRPPRTAELIADIRRVASELGRSRLSQEDYRAHGRFRPGWFALLGGWRAAVWKAGLSYPLSAPKIPTERLDADLKRVAGLLGRKRLTMADYRRHGRFNALTFFHRFGSWGAAVRHAGLKSSRRRVRVPPRMLVDDLKHVAGKLGRKWLTWKEYKVHGKFSYAPFRSRMGGWFRALAQAGLSPWPPDVAAAGPAGPQSGRAGPRQKAAGSRARKAARKRP